MITALLIVDCQPTFCEGGELPVEGGNQVCQSIAQYLIDNAMFYEVTAATLDWHEDAPEHFAEWGPHGIAGTPNADLHPAFADNPHLIDFLFKKGATSAALSAFDGQMGGGGADLVTALENESVEVIDVCGLALDVCVKATCLDARNRGYDVNLLIDLSRPVKQENVQATINELEEAGVKMMAGLSIERLGAT